MAVFSFRVFGSSSKSVCLTWIMQVYLNSQRPPCMSAIIFAELNFRVWISSNYCFYSVITYITIWFIDWPLINFKLYSWSFFLTLSFIFFSIVSFAISVFFFSIILLSIILILNANFFSFILLTTPITYSSKTK